MKLPPGLRQLHFTVPASQYRHQLVKYRYNVLKVLIITIILVAILALGLGIKMLFDPKPYNKKGIYLQALWNVMSQK